MKKFNLISLLFILLLTSCSSDKEIVGFLEGPGEVTNISIPQDIVVQRTINQREAALKRINRTKIGNNRNIRIKKYGFINIFSHDILSF